jgi:hypothetical protein
MKEEFRLAVDTCDKFSSEYREVFYRYAGTSKKKKKRVIIDQCTTNKLHNVSHVAWKCVDTGVMLHTDTQRGEEGMRDVKGAYSHTQRRNDDSTEYQMLFYMSRRQYVLRAMGKVNEYVEP